MDTNNYGSQQFLLSVPKKQAKSYEIDLGQNEGAYKEELLIRYGDNTLNQMMNKRHPGSNMNMEDVMRMNEQLKPFQERPKFDGVKSYSQLCAEIEDKLGKIDDNSAYLKQFENDLNKAIEVMTNDIFKFFDDSYNEFNPKLLEKYKYLKTKIKEQKDENANLLKQIDLLLQENTQIMDMVYKVGARLENLEKKVGIEKEEPGKEKMEEDLSREGESSLEGEEKSDFEEEVESQKENEEEKSQEKELEIAEVREEEKENEKVEEKEKGKEEEKIEEQEDEKEEEKEKEENENENEGNGELEEHLLPFNLGEIKSEHSAMKSEG